MELSTADTSDNISNIAFLSFYNCPSTATELCFTIASLASSFSTLNLSSAFSTSRLLFSSSACQKKVFLKGLMLYIYINIYMQLKLKLKTFFHVFKRICFLTLCIKFKINNNFFFSICRLIRCKNSIQN